MQKPNKTLQSLGIDSSWTLFLDRDGVINTHAEGYVSDIKNFIFIDGVLEAIKKLSALFGRIIVVTNQQGIGKKLMTVEELDVVHQHMLYTIKKHDGKIDKIYFAPQLESENSRYRKPNTGMALQAKQDFPEINFSKSVVVGDSISDMQLGKNIRAYTVYVGKFLPEYDPKLIDYQFNSLYQFSQELFATNTFLPL